MDFILVYTKKEKRWWLSKIIIAGIQRLNTYSFLPADHPLPCTGRNFKIPFPGITFN